MKVYEIGYGTYEESSFAQLMHAETLTADQLEAMVLECALIALEAKKAEYEAYRDELYREHCVPESAEYQEARQRSIEFHMRYEAEHYSPIDAELLAAFCADEADKERAVEEARKAREEWESKTPEQRAEEDWQETCAGYKERLESGYYDFDPTYQDIHHKTVELLIERHGFQPVEFEARVTFMGWAHLRGGAFLDEAGEPTQRLAARVQEKYGQREERESE